MKTLTVTTEIKYASVAKTNENYRDQAFSPQTIFFPDESFYFGFLMRSGIFDVIDQSIKTMIQDNDADQKCTSFLAGQKLPSGGCETSRDFREVAHPCNSNIYACVRMLYVLTETYYDVSFLCM